ncbi:MAG: hypothetical protein NWE93_10625 [Candidatus Bathyarchaeota archaeon]|nr:hypothetical protein [Candidatus Bathyarchaeota archaeon]
MILSDDFSRDSGSWQYEGTANRDSANQNLVLTTNNCIQGGAAFLNVPIRGSFTASFRYKTGGDGFTLFFYKQQYSQLDIGGSLGFSSRPDMSRDCIPVPGYGVEFDAWQNIPYDFNQFTGCSQNPQGDPSGSHVALIKDFSGNHLSFVNDSRASDGNWHRAIVEVQASSVRVYIDQDLVLQWSGTFDRTYSGLGFSAGTGSSSSWHIVDDFSISSDAVHVPTLTTSCVSSSSQSSLQVKIAGQLTQQGNPIPNAPIMLSYSASLGESWQDLTSVHTTSDGSFSAVWLLTATGDYMLKAFYPGSENYLSTTNIMNFSITPCLENSVFSVTSNSTLTELAFNSAAKELNFRVSGESGTTGYVSFYIPNSLVSDISNLKLYLDSAQIDFNVQPQSEGWLLYATYHHSSHFVKIALGSANLDSPTDTQPTAPTMPSNLSQGNTATLDWLIKVAILISIGVLTALSIIVATRYLMKK